MTNDNPSDEFLEKLATTRILLLDWGYVRVGDEIVSMACELLQYRKATGVSFYRDGVVAAAQWVEQQRESYDNEHGRNDPDTGTFEFGNDAQAEYSATLAEIAEGIRALHPNAAPQPAPVVPDEQHSERFDWTLGQWAEHLGGHYQGNDPANYYEFGSFMAVAAMLSQFGTVQQKLGWNACRAAMLQTAEATPQPLTANERAELQQYRKAESADREMLKRLAVILSGSDAPGEIRALTVTAQSFVDRCKLLAQERDKNGK